MNIDTIHNSGLNVESVFGQQIRIVHIQKTTNKSVTYVLGFHPEKTIAKQFLKEVTSKVGASGFHKRIDEMPQEPMVFGFFGDHKEAIHDLLIKKFDISEMNITM